MKYLPAFALALATAHSGVFAADTIEENHGWHTSAELGAITTSGNTTGTTVTGKIDARQELDEWSNEYIATGFFKEDRYRDGDQWRSKRSAERFSISAKAAYKLVDDQEKLFVLGSHVDDQFGAFTRYSNLAVGHATRWFESPTQTLDVELGPGYINRVRANGDEESGLTVRGAAAMRWKISPSASFSQTVSMESGAGNVHSVAETALSTKINGTMQMKAAFSARNDSNVPVDKKNTDTQTSVTLVYSF
jgi:putative salt-induced outer membrane protein YdiY